MQSILRDSKRPKCTKRWITQQIGKAIFISYNLVNAAPTTSIRYKTSSD